MLPRPAGVGNYVDLGKSDDAVADEQVEADVSGISLSAVGFLPIGPVDRFARIGAVDWEADLDSPSLTSADPATAPT